MVEWLVGVDGEVGRVIDVAVVEAYDDEHGDDSTDKHVQCGEERHHERVDTVSQHVPVEGRDGVEAETADAASYDAQVGVVGGDPGHPAEVAESNEDVVREPEVEEHGGKGNGEELETRPPPDHSQRAWYRQVAIGVESAVKRDRDQRAGPHAITWVDEETSADTSKAVANEVSREGDENLVTEVNGPRLVKVLGQDLDPDDIVGVWGRLGDRGHNGNKHMLLSVEGTGIEAVADAKECKADIRESLLHELAEREGEQLGHVGGNVDGGLANLEEAVDEGDGTREEDTEDPGADGGAGHAGVIVVVDN